MCGRARWWVTALAVAVLAACVHGEKQAVEANRGASITAATEPASPTGAVGATATPPPPVLPARPNGRTVPWYPELADEHPAWCAVALELAEAGSSARAMALLVEAAIARRAEFTRLVEAAASATPVERALAIAHAERHLVDWSLFVAGYHDWRARGSGAAPPTSGGVLPLEPPARVAGSFGMPWDALLRELGGLAAEAAQARVEAVARGERLGVQAELEAARQVDPPARAALLAHAGARHDRTLEFCTAHLAR